MIVFLEQRAREINTCLNLLIKGVAVSIECLIIGFLMTPEKAGWLVPKSWIASVGELGKNHLLQGNSLVK